MSSWVLVCHKWLYAFLAIFLWGELMFIDGSMFTAASWASYQIRKIAGCACAGNAGNVFPHRRLRRKSLVSDPGMHPGTCVTHVPWCMSGSLTRAGGENFPGILGACAPAILAIWQVAHDVMTWKAFRIIGSFWGESFGHTRPSIEQMVELLCVETLWHSCHVTEMYWVEKTGTL